MEIRNTNLCISYLRARDPSIISFNRVLPIDSRRKLEDLMDDTNPAAKVPKLGLPEDNNNMKVYLRIKGGVPESNLYSVEDKSLLCRVPTGSHSLLNANEYSNITKKYLFSHIFQPATCQEDIFNYIVKPKVLDVINGNSSTLLTYGASGSGKTYTIVGTNTEPGIIPRALEYLFRSLPQLSTHPLVKPTADGGIKDLTDLERKASVELRTQLLLEIAASVDSAENIRIYKSMQQRLSGETIATLDASSTRNVSLSMWISFAEIYNEQIFDLLEASPPPGSGNTRKRLRLGTTHDHRNYIKELRVVHVTSGLEAYQLLNYGLHNLNYASTAVNSHSSRSHAIFTIQMAQATHRPGRPSRGSASYVTFCDLAGSERLKKTKNVGERLKESNNINTSLLVLGRCMKMIRTAQKTRKALQLPFRESKLTQLFQRALSGAEEIAMIVNVNPVRDMFEETQHVLCFSAIVKDITVVRKEENKKPPSRFSEYLEAEAARNAIAQSERELELESALFEMDEQHRLDRQQLTEDFDNELKDSREHVNQYINEVMARYRKKMADLTAHYDAQLAAQQTEIDKLRMQLSTKPVSVSDTSVISIADSDDDEDTTATNHDDSKKAGVWEGLLMRVEGERDQALEELRCARETMETVLREYEEFKVEHRRQIGFYKGLLADAKTDREALVAQYEKERNSNVGHMKRVIDMEETLGLYDIFYGEEEEEDE